MADHANTHKEDQIGGFDKFEVEGWLRSMQEAQEISTDKKKMDAVQELAGEKMAAIHSIKQLKIKAGRSNVRE